jgi:antagonist of KipI
MSVLEILKPGMLTTVQDLGREGFGAMGVSPSGAADAISLRLGNRLVCNPESAAGLEMTLLGGAFRFPDGAVVTLTGSDFGATLDGFPVNLWTSIDVRPNQTLEMGRTMSGARCYLCLQGGVEVPQILRSSSTHLLSGLGGFEGRPLRKGDVLRVGFTNLPFRKRTMAASALERLSPRKVLRVTSGPQMNWFSGASLRSFYSSEYRVGDQSNRMGLRLEGAPLAPRPGLEMVTEGVPLGAVQLTSKGLPIILFVEQQTTGGYPKIANVISADLHSVGQLCPRDEIRFRQVTLETARELLFAQEKLLASRELILE